MRSGNRRLTIAATLAGSVVLLAAQAGAAASPDAVMRCHWKAGKVVKKPGERCVVLRKSGALVTITARR